MCRRRPARIHVSAHTPSPSYISILPCAQHRGQVKCCNETPVRIRGFYILACNHYAGVGAGITFNRTFGAILGTRPAAVPATTDGAKSIEKLSTAPLVLSWEKRKRLIGIKEFRVGIHSSTSRNLAVEGRIYLTTSALENVCSPSLYLFRRW